MPLRSLPLAAASCLLLGGLGRDARGQVTVLDPVSPGGISITIGADGLGLISYIDFNGDGLNVAHCSDAACSSATITSLDAPLTSQFLGTAIATGADGLGLIAYDTGIGTMKIAHCSNVLCTQATISDLGTGTVSKMVIGSD